MKTALSVWPVSFKVIQQKVVHVDVTGLHVMKADHVFTHHFNPLKTNRSRIMNCHLLPRQPDLNGLISVCNSESKRYGWINTLLIILC